MKTHRVTRSLSLLATLALVFLSTAACEVTSGADVQSRATRDLAEETPEAVGMSSERLARLSETMQGIVDDGKLAGIVTMVARHGKVVHFETFGQQDIESATPMKRDSIFRIYSMTKPITGVALMTLYEEGRFRLADPVEKYIPELEGLKVASGIGADGQETEDADHPMTIRELMTHTAGLTYGFFSESQVDEMYREAEVLDSGSTLEDMIEKLARIPLRQQPGSTWHYSVAVDVQSYLVEVLSGQSFDVFLQERIFEPLAMNDTGFHVPANKTDRFAQLYTYGEDGGLTVREESLVPHNYLEPATLFAGGHGLVSSTMDYMRFCQMLLNGGELDGVRILSPTTVALMQRNQLPRAVEEIRPGVGFGLDFAVVMDPVEAETFSKGEYSWGGLAGTWFWIDPAEDLVFVGMIQQLGEGRPDVRSLARRLTYQAILELSD
ncbi:MAG: class A beta-lactamase-related serine hydrolase [Acidobacteria bacterium]|nr:MAG: class A beta-lactamase-related serine hydrolase [Acidobacteriota bacterium]